ncbi:MAG: autotransporter domain-containing protein [Alphaproteobacteria bacterium]|nr:autotransporter domain-containing protein [Alphaproteobacteria bacterium]
MKRFGSRLKVSVSIVALASASPFFAAPARAVTISSDQTGFSATSDITDGLTVAEGVTVSPGNIFVDPSYAFQGNLTNNGTVQLTLDDDPDSSDLYAAISVPGTLDGDLSNNDEIEASETATDSQMDDVDVEGPASVGGPLYAASDVAGVYVGVLNGDLDNAGNATGTASSENDYTANVVATGDASVGLSSRAFSNAAGIWVYDLEGTLTNSGDAAIAAVSESTTNADATASGANVWIRFDELNSSSGAVGIRAGNTYQAVSAQAIVNDGSVSASAHSGITANASASSNSGEARADWGTIYAPSGAQGILVEGRGTELTNTGEVDAAAQSSVQVSLEARGPTALVSPNVPSSVMSIARGIDGLFEGTVSNTGQVVATGQADLSLLSSTVAVDGNSTIDLTSVPVDVQSVGIDTGDDITSTILGNSGAINSSAAATIELQHSSSADAGSASIKDTGAADSGSHAAGVNITGAKSASNSGDVVAQAATTAGVDLASSGQSNDEGDAASIVVAYDFGSDAAGVAIDQLAETFDNGGSIAAAGSSETTFTANASASDGSALVNSDVSTVGTAVGVGINALGGDFSNGGDATIDATATATLDAGLSASGTSARVTSSSAETTSDARGVDLAYGEHAVVNDGSISASATSTGTLNASADGGEGPGQVALGSNLTGSLALGVRDSGISTGFTNTGDIQADAVSTASYGLSASGGADSGVVFDNTFWATAIGVELFGANPVQGDFDNSGNIVATATGTLGVSVASSAGEEAGLAWTGTGATLSAVGVVIKFAAPPVVEEGGGDQAAQQAAGEPYSFTNSGDISATGVLSLVMDVPAGTGESSGQTTGISFNVLSVEIAGPVGAVTNSGTIAATGSLDVSGTGDVSGTAGVIGLWLHDAGAGSSVTNSGTISADLTGNADLGTAVAAVVLGPGVILPPPPDGGQDQTVTVGRSGGSMSGTDTGLGYTTAPGDVITLTNSGTISATNEMGTAYGIYAETAPVPVVINQQGGSISGDVAIAINQGNADTLNWTGGEIHGVVDADGTDVVNVFAGTGTPDDGVITAGADFTLSGGASLNVGTDADAPVTLHLDGTVDGTGTANVNEGAALELGPTGQMTVGTFNMDPSATLAFQFLPDEAGHIGVTGDANIDGTLTAEALPGLYGNSGSHVVLETGGSIVGSFENVDVTGDTLLLDFSASVGDQDITVSWERTAFDAVPGLTVNADSVAGALEAGYDPSRTASGNSPELNDILSGMFTLTDAGHYDRVLNSWSGSEHAQVMRAAANLSEPYHAVLSEHLNDIRRSGAPDGQVVMLRPRGSSSSIAPLSTAGASSEGSRFGFWGRAVGRWASTRGDVEADGYDEDTYGAVLGADFAVSPNVVLGIVGSYMDDNVKFDDGDRGKVKRWTIGGYVSATFDRFYMDGSVTYASDNYRVNRTIMYGDTSCLSYTCTQGASSKYDGNGWMAHAELGYVADLGGGTSLQPFAGLNYSSVSLDPFSETGGGDLGLDVLDGKGRSLQSRLGARLTGEWGSGTTKWIPELRAEWRHEFKDDPAWISANLAGLPNEPFTAIGSKVAGDLAVVGAGITAVMQNGVGLFLDYQGAFGSGYNSHLIQGGVRVRF